MAMYPCEPRFIDLTVKSAMYPFIDLDNGCYMNNRSGFGNLLGLELEAMDLGFQPILTWISFTY